MSELEIIDTYLAWKIPRTLVRGASIMGKELSALRESKMIDLSKNYLPENMHHIHLMGIYGTGMGSLAGMLKEKGYQITGSDPAVYPPMSTFLANLGIEVIQGYGPENLKPHPDLVIVGNVITQVNPEAQRFLPLELPFLSLPQAVAQLFLKDKISLVITGTHGKTDHFGLVSCHSGSGRFVPFLHDRRSPQGL